MILTDYHMEAVDVVATFPTRDNGDRQFLHCWIPEKQLTAAIEACMRSHGDPDRWWDGLHKHLLN
jgi:hypothetical protein